MKTQLKEFTYDAYLIVILILTFFSFIGPMQPYLLPLLVGMGVLMILAKKSVFYVIPIPFFIQMSFSDLRDNVQVTTVYSLIFLVLIVFDVIKNRHFTKKGYLVLPLAVLTLLSVLTYFNGPDLFSTFAGFVQMASVLVLYYYFINTLNGKDDNFKYVAKLMMYMAVLVSLEMMYVIYQSGELATTVIRSRQIDLGWENLNVIIYSNLISIPMIAYLIHKAKIKIFYMLFALISIVGILLTLSRSSVFSLGIFIVFLVPLMIKISTNRKLLFIQGAVFLLMLAGFVYYTETHFELISTYIEAMQSRDLTYIDDRVAILKVAWEQLKLHPLLGSGGLYSSRVHLLDSGIGALNYHNTIAQISTLGSFGILSFVYLFFKKTKLIMLSKSSFKWFALLMVYVTTFINGSLQPMYFYTTYMVFLFLVLATIEVNNEALK